MRAVVVRGAGKLEVGTVPDPEPRPDQLVLRVASCGICGSDLHLHQHGLLPPGTVMGHEFCGEVVETRGDWRAGERVCALPNLSCGECERCRSGMGAYCTQALAIGLGAAPGAFAEFVAVAPHEVVRLPDGVDDDHGAMVEPLAVGLHAVNVGRIRRGERCLVIGAGPIGLAIALWARHFGAEEVIVSDPVAARRAMAERMGASRVIDPVQEDVAAALANHAPGGAGVVFESAGVPGLLASAVEHVRFRGRVVVVGICLEADAFPPLPAILKEATLHFVLGYEKDDFQFTVDLLDQGRIVPAPMVTDCIGLDAVPTMFDTLATPQGQCKVLVFPGS